MFFLLNLSQALFADDCEWWPETCERQAEAECRDICDLLDPSEECDYVQLAYWWCSSGLCRYYYDLYCDGSGYQETIGMDCDICPF